VKQQKEMSSFSIQHAKESTSGGKDGKERHVSLRGKVVARQPAQDRRASLQRRPDGRKKHINEPPSTKKGPGVADFVNKKRLSIKEARAIRLE